MEEDDFIPFDETCPKARVRCTWINMILFMSIRDLIMYISDQSKKRATETWIRIHSKQAKTFKDDIAFHQFDGQGEKIMPVITVKGMSKLMAILPGKKAKEIRVKAADIISRYVEGKESLVKKVRVNKQLGPAAACASFLSKASSSVFKDLPQATYLYATKTDAFPGLIKIGRSSDIDARLSNLNTGCAPSPHYIVAVAPTFDAVRDKDWVLNHFSDFRVQGEFFSISEETIKTFFRTQVMEKYQMELSVICA
jgi:hypothetical protein